MATETFVDDCIVLKKTKLGESDLIITFLNEQGERLQGIAKGARKPQSTFSSYLELGNLVHILFARGKKLAVITETRLLTSHPMLLRDAQRFAAASCILELVGKTSEENLVQPRLFAMTNAALDLCETIEERYLAHLVASFFFKASSFQGLRPSISACAACGMDMDPGNASYVAFSYQDGGALCQTCSRDLGHSNVNGSVLVLVNRLISTPFADIPSLDPRSQAGKALLDLARNWISVHQGAHIRSLEMRDFYC